MFRDASDCSIITRLLIPVSPKSRAGPVPLLTRSFVMPLHLCASGARVGVSAHTDRVTLDPYERDCADTHSVGVDREEGKISGWSLRHGGLMLIWMIFNSANISKLQSESHNRSWNDIMTSVVQISASWKGFLHWNCLDISLTWPAAALPLKYTVSME